MVIFLKQMLCYKRSHSSRSWIRIETSIGTEERNLIKRTSFALSLPLKNESKIKSTYCYYWKGKRFYLWRFFLSSTLWETLQHLWSSSHSPVRRVRLSNQSRRSYDHTNEGRQRKYTSYTSKWRHRKTAQKGLSKLKSQCRTHSS